jgi:hypothetical protein
MGPTDIEPTEDAFAGLLSAFGDLVVARTRGEPVEPRLGSTVALARRYRARRRAFDSLLATSGQTPDRATDAAALDNMQATLEWLDELEPTPGAVPTAGGGSDEAPAIRALRASVYRRYGLAASHIRVGSETIDRLTALARLGSEPDPAVRRAIFEAMEPVWQSVDGAGDGSSPYRRLVRASAARWATHGSTIEANAVALGMAPGTAEETFRTILGAWRDAMGSAAVEPWDYRYVVGAAGRRLDRLVPQDRLLPLDHAYLATLGADPDALGIRYDVLPRPDRPVIPVAFTIGTGLQRDDVSPTGWRVRPAWVFATYSTGGLGNLQELLHESGHALAAAGLRTRPAYSDYPMASAAFLEATADILGWDVTEPGWQQRWLGEAASPREALLDRYGSVMLDVAWALFEIELHRHPDRRANDVWSEITGEGLGIIPHPEWSWWAARGQLIDAPGYLANYALSAIVAAAVRGRILEERGPWWDGDPGWYGYLAERLFAPGASRSPAMLLRDLLGGPLTAEPLLDDLRRAG